MEQLKNKNILFISGHNGRDELMFRLSKELQKRWNIKSFFYTGVKEGGAFLINRGVPKENIHTVVYDDDKEDYLQPDIEYIKKAEERYGFNCWEVWQISAPRNKKRQRFCKDKVLSWMEYFIKEAEKVIKKFKPNYVINQGIASFASVIFCKIMLYHNIYLLDIVNSRIPNRLTFNNNLEDEWPLLIKEYNQTKDRNLSQEEIIEAKNFITGFLKQPFKPDDYLAKKNIPLNTKLKKYGQYLKMLKSRKQLPPLKQYLWPILDKLLDHTNTFEMPPAKQEKYVYYPLHVDPETSISLYGKWHVNQLTLVEQISKSLPCDCALYVKEHILNYSSRPRYFHKEIKKYPNVRLISPHANSIELIKNCSLLVTITGTAGWEAIILQKPVITFGKVYYNIFDEVSTVENIEKLPELIKKNIDKSIDEMKTLKFIVSIFNSTFNGIGATPGDCEMKSLEQANVCLIANGLEKFIKYINK